MSWKNSVRKGVGDREEAAGLLSQVIEDIRDGKEILIISRLKQILDYLESE
jgi:hypothetical protein|tara:strand:- start:397 stop:549 length:153 start_codon:yes stop_codon:yes gene_type:complete